VVYVLVFNKLVASMYRRLLLLLSLIFATPVFSATFDKDVAPIVFQHCAPCHHAGGIGPFPLLNYSDVSKHADQIVTVTQSRYMPPWPPEHGIGEFAGDRSLSPEQIRLISDWVKQGKPQGAAFDLPVPPRFDSAWQLGPPDLVLKMDKGFLLAAAGPDIFRNFILRSGVTRTRYVRGFELHMNNSRVVHHANVVLDRTQALRKRDGVDGQPGFEGMDVITEAAPDSFDPDSHFLFYKPGSFLTFEPPDMAWTLDPGTDLVLNLHLQPTGKPEMVQAEVGLYFTDRAPTRHPMLVQLEHDGALRIPAGSRDFSVTDSLVLPVDVQLLAVYPHAHYLGKQMDAWAILPDGKRVSLIRILDWDINWQAVYNYRKPLFLPKGTRLEMRISYDNSEQNPRNPNHPPRLVTAGNRSQDEMGHVWFQLLVVTNGKTDQDPRLPIQEAVMRRRLEKYPADFLAHYNLAALLQSEGKLPEAISLYQTALRESPTSATAHNSLASALLMQDDLPAAIAELHQALACDPNYVSAHYNLAHALAVTGDLAQSAVEFRAVLAADPDDAAANADLGAIEYKLHDYEAALKHLRRAAQSRPADADLQTNLGTVLAITGDLAAAQQAFEAALRLDPAQSAAKANLQVIRAKLANR
jgi:tetratricopeptide (TPR) repeat protein